MKNHKLTSGDIGHVVLVGDTNDADDTSFVLGQHGQYKLSLPAGARPKSLPCSNRSGDYIFGSCRMGGLRMNVTKYASDHHPVFTKCYFSAPAGAAHAAAAPMPPPLPTAAPTTLPGGFRVGDRVRRTRNSANGLFKIGQIGTVRGPKSATRVMVDYPHKKGDWNSITSIARLHPMPPPPSSSIRVGDQVRRITNSANGLFKIGQIGTVRGRRSATTLWVDYPHKTGDWNSITSIKKIPNCRKCHIRSRTPGKDWARKYFDHCCRECATGKGYHGAKCKARNGF